MGTTCGACSAGSKVVDDANLKLLLLELGPPLAEAEAVAGTCSHEAGVKARRDRERDAVRASVRKLDVAMVKERLH